MAQCGLHVPCGEGSYIAMQDGYATITPLHRDLTDYNLLKEMEKWRIEK